MFSYNNNQISNLAFVKTCSKYKNLTCVVTDHLAFGMIRMSIKIII